jgi:hypothetical protein
MQWKMQNFSSLETPISFQITRLDAKVKEKKYRQIGWFTYFVFESNNLVAEQRF